MSAIAMQKIKPQLLVWAAVCAYLIDSALKQVALKQAEHVTNGVFDFALFLNKGIAFSIELPKTVYWSSMLMASLALIWAFSVALRGRRDMMPPLTFVAFGALSNLMDRIMIGATVDYLIFFSRSAINIADGMIIGGLIWLFWLEYNRKGQNKVD